MSCPVLRGCHSQGSTREEAIENIKDAIREWLAVDAEKNGVIRIEEELVTATHPIPTSTKVDFAGRRQAIWGGRVFSAEEVTAMRDAEQESEEG